MEVKKYTAAQYKRGSLNLLRSERRLIILALIKSDWNTKKAFELNFPNPTMTIDSYWKLIKRHHISVVEKKFLKLSEIN